MSEGSVSVSSKEFSTVEFDPFDETTIFRAKTGVAISVPNATVNLVLEHCISSEFNFVRFKFHLSGGTSDHAHFKKFQILADQEPLAVERSKMTPIIPERYQPKGASYFTYRAQGYSDINLEHALKIVKAENIEARLTLKAGYTDLDDATELKIQRALALLLSDSTDDKSLKDLHHQGRGRTQGQQGLLSGYIKLGLFAIIGLIIVTAIVS